MVMPIKTSAFFATWSSQCFFALLSIVLLGSGTIMFAPLIIPYTVSLGGLPVHGTLIEGTSRIIAAIGVIYLGKAAATLGRKRTLIYTYLLGATSIFFTGFATNLFWLLCTSALVSLSFASMCAIMMVYLAEIAPDGCKGMALGIYGMGIGMSAVTGSVVGTMLADSYGLRVPFFVGGVVVLFAILITHIFIAESEKESFTGEAQGSGLHGLKLLPTLFKCSLLFIPLYVGAFCYQFVQSSLTTLLTPLVQGIGFPINVAGMGIGVFGVFAFMQPIGGWVGDRLGRRVTLIGGGLILVVGLLRLYTVTTLSTILLGTALLGVGTSFFLPSVTTGVSMLANKQSRVAVMALYQAIITLGAIVGPISGGFVLHYLGTRAPFLMNAIVMAFVCLLFIFISIRAKDAFSTQRSLQQ